MKNTIKKGKIAALLSLAGLGVIGLSKADTFSFLEYTNEILKGIVEKFVNISKDRAEDKVYLHFDKPFYKPGETIWFKAYIRNGSNLKASLKSDILHIELINPKGSIEKEIKLIIKNGASSGDFELDESVAGGLYKIKAYTNWQKNENAFFEKELTVQAVVLPKLKMKLDFDRKAYGPGDAVTATLNLTTLENEALSNQSFKYIVNLAGNKFTELKGNTTQDGSSKITFTLPENLKTNDGLLNIMIDFEGSTESISRSVPIILNEIKLSFFPEGGDLIAGLNNRIAFKALNELGKPADIDGIILDSKNNKVASFSSFHQGMGAFDFNPLKGESYTVQITKPEKIKNTFQLPEALSRGYNLKVNRQINEVINIVVESTEAEELSILVQTRGIVYHAESFKVIPGKNIYSVSANKFPIGIAQFTLFDSKGIERAERLSFLNKDKQLNISIETDKEKYLPREKVNMTIKVSDDRGLPMPANLSLAVTDDKLLAFADDKQGNVLSQMLFESDITEKVEEASFYFDKKQAKADEALDYVLMTSGWRRFTWKQIMENEIPMIQYDAEKAILSGIVLDGHTSKPVQGAIIAIENTNIKTSSDQKGFFTIHNVDLSELRTLTVSSKGFSNGVLQLDEYNSNLNVFLYTDNYGYRNRAGAGNIRPMMAPGERNIQEMDLAGNVRMEEEMIMPVAALMRKDNKAVVKKEIAPVEIAEPELAKPKIMDRRIMASVVADKKKKIHADFDDLAFEPQILEVKYYRAKQFSAPDYSNSQQVEVRTDFRSTIYWNGNVSTDRTGKTILSFYNSDEITSFRATAEGFGVDGSVGRAEKTYFTQLPFSMSVKVPTELTTGDLVSIPLTLKNNTSGIISGNISIKTPESLQLVSSLNTLQSIAADQTKTIFLDYKVTDKPGKDTIEFSFNSTGNKDAFSQEIKVSSKGFPSALSFAGKDIEKEYVFDIKNLVKGSLKADFTAYPSVVSDLMKGIASIIREPYGCFEQTSTSNYPNIMVKQYFEESGQEGLPSEVNLILDKGYKRLITFETKEKGYEWFGGSPAHEGLTAYGLMQFNDMQRVYNNVDGEMINRTMNWLMNRRDGKGGFQRSAQALDQFGRASEDVTNAYIVYALSEAGNRDIVKELDKAYDKAVSSKDPYQLALIANAMFNFKDKNRASKLMELLYAKQDKNGSWTGSAHSITYSQGISLTVETTSLAILAILKSENPDQKAMSKGIENLMGSRSGYGGFGSTQGTILALKALTEYAKYSKKTDEDGTIELYVDNKKVAEKSYKAGEREAIVIPNVENYLSPGRHTVKVKYVGVKNPLPYSLGINWSTSLPDNDAECKVSLETKLSSKTALTGETVRLSSTLKNTTKEGLPMTMAIIGIPAGLSAQPWQLKELQDKKTVDFYEVRENNVFFYYRQMLPEEVRVIHLDLKAEMPGEYEAQASSAYLYYTSEYKVWSTPDRVIIKKK